MIEILRIGRGLWQILYLCSLKLCIFGWQRICLLCRLVLMIFFFALLFLVWLFLLYNCTLSVYLGAPHAFNEIGIITFWPASHNVSNLKSKDIKLTLNDLRFGHKLTDGENS
jgi:hypothetical protein